MNHESPVIKFIALSFLLAGLTICAYYIRTWKTDIEDQTAFAVTVVGLPPMVTRQPTATWLDDRTILYKSGGAKHNLTCELLLLSRWIRLRQRQEKRLVEMEVVRGTVAAPGQTLMGRYLMQTEAGKETEPAEGLIHLPPDINRSDVISLGADQTVFSSIPCLPISGESLRYAGDKNMFEIPLTDDFSAQKSGAPAPPPQPQSTPR